MEGSGGYVHVLFYSDSVLVAALYDEVRTYTVVNNSALVRGQTFTHSSEPVFGLHRIDDTSGTDYLAITF